MDDVTKTPPLKNVDRQQNPIILILGVGGSGTNAVNHMYRKGIKGVDFCVINTDSQSLAHSPVPNKLQLGVDGHGAGANPEKARRAVEESTRAIEELFSRHTRMVFIVAGMGGGTGTGAAPFIAELAKRRDMLTIGIITRPFTFEGKGRQKKAEIGAKQMREHCDTVLEILNDKLVEVVGSEPMRNAFAYADEIQTSAAKSLAEIVTVHGHVNVDFEDVRTTLKGAGLAMMGSGTATQKEKGDNSVLEACRKALASELLDQKNLGHAGQVLLSVVTSKPENEPTMKEVSTLTDYIRGHLGDSTELIFGNSHDPELGDQVQVNIIATGFDESLFNREGNAAGQKGGKRTGKPTSYGVGAMQKQNLKEEIDSLIRSYNAAEFMVLTEEAFQELQAEPAYLRKNISLHPPVHPAGDIIRRELQVS